jgi:hypothetical protein
VARLIAALGQCPITTSTQTQLRPTYVAAGALGRPTPGIGAEETARRSPPSFTCKARATRVTDLRLWP